MYLAHKYSTSTVHITLTHHLGRPILPINSSHLYHAQILPARLATYQDLATIMSSGDGKQQTHSVPQGLQVPLKPASRSEHAMEDQATPKKSGESHLTRKKAEKRRRSDVSPGQLPSGTSARGRERASPRKFPMTHHHPTSSSQSEAANSSQSEAKSSSQSEAETNPRADPYRYELYQAIEADTKLVKQLNRKHKSLMDKERQSDQSDPDLERKIKSVVAKIEAVENRLEILNEDERTFWAAEPSRKGPGLGGERNYCVKIKEIQRLNKDPKECCRILRVGLRELMGQPRDDNKRKMIRQHVQAIHEQYSLIDWKGAPGRSTLGRGAWPDDSTANTRELRTPAAQRAAGSAPQRGSRVVIGGTLPNTTVCTIGIGLAPDGSRIYVFTGLPEHVSRAAADSAAATILADGDTMVHAGPRVVDNLPALQLARSQQQATTLGHVSSGGGGGGGDGAAAGQGNTATPIVPPLSQQQATTLGRVSSCGGGGAAAAAAGRGNTATPIIPWERRNLVSRVAAPMDSSQANPNDPREKWSTDGIPRPPPPTCEWEREESRAIIKKLREEGAPRKYIAHVTGYSEVTVGRKISDIVQQEMDKEASERERTKDESALRNKRELEGRVKALEEELSKVRDKDQKP
jgi:hypothetical protein